MKAILNYTACIKQYSREWHKARLRLELSAHRTGMDVLKSRTLEIFNKAERANMEIANSHPLITKKEFDDDARLVAVRDKYVVVVGASGRIGSAVVKSLAEVGHKLVLVSRQPEKLKLMFPTETCISQPDLPDYIDQTRVVVYLSAMNNDQLGTELDFYEANVRMPVMLYQLGLQARVEKFLYFSSIKVLDSRSSDVYTETKIEAEKQLMACLLSGKDREGSLKVIRLAAVYGGLSERGNLRFLNRLPGIFVFPVSSILNMIKPIVRQELVVEETMKELGDNSSCGALKTIRDPFENSFYSMVKRLLDIIGGLVLAVLIGWMIPLVWCIVKLDSPGPGFFLQKRLGMGKQQFNFFKFRTMQVNTIECPTHMVDGERVTTIGKWLRKYKVDELPQVWNVLRGEMSFIGPRPGLRKQTELVDFRTKLGVYNVKPGITGLAQVRRVDMSNPEKLARIDADYISCIGLVTDFRIALATVLGKGGGDRVVRKSVK